ncbi:MAG: SHOCT domain-containing protein [Crocinitomicaceae bacterium]|nr:SHOCT domain-containing protein [Crocinitomicaceae bacterium]
MYDDIIAAFFILLLVIIVALAFYGFLCSSLKKTLELVDKKNRTMSPKNIWWLILPIFNAYWFFHVVIRVSKSIKNEFKSRKINLKDYDEIEFNEDNPGYGFGLTAAIFNLLSYVVGPEESSDIAIYILSFIGLVFTILYWVRINKYKEILLKSNTLKNATIEPSSKPNDEIVKEKPLDETSDKLKQLKGLFDNGLITQEEYDLKRKSLIDEI